MENNPILINYRPRMLYAGIWALVVILQSVVVYLSTTGLTLKIAEKRQ